jgi:hypothetical protein
MFLALEEGYWPHEDDVYNPDLPNFGNRNYGVKEASSTLNWDGSTDSYVDIRLFFSFRARDSWSKCRWDPKDESIPKFWSYSDVTEF